MRLGAFLVLAGLVNDAIAQAITDYDLTSAEAIWTFGECMVAFALGFAGGTKAKLTRQIIETM